MFESISLKFTEFAEPLLVPAHEVTIFVGPNNSWKSLVLREIEQDIVKGAVRPIVLCGRMPRCAMERLDERDALA